MSMMRIVLLTLIALFAVSAAHAGEVKAVQCTSVFKAEHRHLLADNNAWASNDPSLRTIHECVHTSGLFVELFTATLLGVHDEHRALYEVDGRLGYQFDVGNGWVSKTSAAYYYIKPDTATSFGIIDMRTALSKPFSLSPTLTATPMFMLENMYKVENGHNDISTVIDGTLSQQLTDTTSLYVGARWRHHFDATGDLLEARLGVAYNVTPSFTIVPEGKFVHGPHTAAHNAGVFSLTGVLRW